MSSLPELSVVSIQIFQTTINYTNKIIFYTEVIATLAVKHRAVAVGDWRDGTKHPPTYYWGSMLPNLPVKFDSILSAHHFNIGIGKINASQYIKDPRARVVSILEPSAVELTQKSLSR